MNSLGITNVITIHPKEEMRTSNSSQDMSLKTTNINFMMSLEEKSGDHHSQLPKVAEQSSGQTKLGIPREMLLERLQPYLKIIKQHKESIQLS